MYSLVDANNFYVSCERSFNPALEEKPVVVLSNRDGNIVARSNEAKALGIKMGAAFFESKAFIAEHNVQVFSSNYTLYADLSARLMSILAQFVADVEVYSIDEAFLSVAGYDGIYPSYEGLAKSIRETIDTCLRIPVSVGIAPTKTLCKVANWYAKRRPDLEGVCVLDNQQAIDEALAGFDIEELWGVGYRYAKMLKKNGIKTAAHLRDVPIDWIRDTMTVNGVRLVYELQGRPCKLLEVGSKPKKSICTEPGFGKVIPDLAMIEDALTHHLSRLCEKLRKQDSLAGCLTVYLRTNHWRKTPGNGLPAKQYSNSRTVRLPHPTNNVPQILTYASAALKEIFAFGYNYQKVGIMLTDLVPADYRQAGIFSAGPDERLIKLARVVDKVNHRFGRDKLRLASQFYNPEWPMNRQFLSPCYTTRWEDILIVQ